MAVKEKETSMLLEAGPAPFHRRRMQSEAEVPERRQGKAVFTFWGRAL